MRRSPRLRRAWLLAFLLLGATIYGVIGYMLVEGWSFLDSLYMTVITLGTVGFREVRPLDANGMIFTITLVLMGVVIVLVTVTTIAAWVSDEQLGKMRRRRRMEKRFDRLSNHFIVCAYGRVGRAVARELASSRVPFIVIDVDEDLEERMRDEEVHYMIGDPSDEAVLEAVGVDRARGLICAVDSDATNVYITLVARSMNPDLLIIARASERNSDERLLKAGANRVVSPYVSSGHHMALMAINPGMTDVFDLHGPQSRSTAPVVVEEILVDDASGLAGRSLLDATGSIVNVLAVRSADGTITRDPAPAVILRPGDMILRLGAGI